MVLCPESDFTLYEDTSDTNLEEYIPAELRGKKRSFLLKMQTVFTDFVNSA